ncbi:MAG TPA: ABC transporter substrate-binding protein [Candidatus Paceibacterota bacterium]
MKKILRRLGQSKIIGKLPKNEELNTIVSSFSKKELIAFFSLVAVLVVSTLLILESINKSFMVGVPIQGGNISEGVVGTPRFINPVLAFSDTDQDLVALIYSGLMRKDAEGNLVPDLASKYDVSSTGLIYSFTLRDNIYFQDNTPVTADDVVFTINSAKDPIIKSPRKGSWDGVTVEKIDDKTVKFTLKQPYASFLENTTLGIMPARVWADSPIELNNANTNPIGSGPYMVEERDIQSSGIINSYTLAPFKKFVLGAPYIENITLRFYSNENDLIAALLGNEVGQISSITPENAETLKEKGYRIESAPLPRIFGLFFNQNQNQIFTNKVVVRAINDAINKSRIVQEVLSGNGLVIDSPIPPDMVSQATPSLAKSSDRAEVIKNVEAALAKDRWKRGTSGFLEKTVTGKNKKKTTTVLEFSISTGNAAELAKSAELIKQDLAEIGMKVDIKTFEIGNLNQSVIRPRKYDALLFGEIINHPSDLYAFWHSSQRKDPGLNVAMYTNAKVDKILEDAFVSPDEKSRKQKYVQFESEVKKDMPAVFLYSPNFLYVVSKNISGLSMENIISPADRFLSVYKWYIVEDNVWKIFAR